MKPDFAPGAASFDEQRAFPDAIATELRDHILNRLPAGDAAKLLEPGIGTGRIAAPFVAAGCRYVGVDASRHMLARCRERFSEARGRVALVLGDMRHLPIADRTFDAVLTASVYRAVVPWQQAVLEASRVLARPGALFLIHHEEAPGSLEAVLGERKRDILSRLNAAAPEKGARDEDVARFLADRGAAVERIESASWTVVRTPRASLARYRRGSRVVDRPWADALMRELEAFAIERYGSLDAEEAVARSLRVYAIRLPG